MTTPQWSLVFAILALIISAWNRLETFYLNKRNELVAQVKRVGDAFVEAQKLKNKLNNKIELLSKIVDKLEKQTVQYYQHDKFVKQLEELQEEYNVLWELVGSFEKILIRYEQEQTLSIPPAVIEAKIARFRQTQELANTDIEFLTTFYDKHFSNEAF